MRSIRYIVFFTAMGLAVFACSSDGENQSDAGADAGTDAGADAGGDADAGTGDDAGPADGDAGDDGGTSGDDGGTSGDDGQPVTCADFHDLSSFVPVEVKGKTKFDAEHQAQKTWIKATDDGSTFGKISQLRVFAWEGLPGYPAAPGAVIELSTIDYNTDAGFRIQIGYDFDEVSKEAQKYFVAMSGTATVTAIDWVNPVGSTFAGTVTGATLVECEFDAEENPIPVPDGCQFSLSSFTWESELTLATGAGDD